MRYDKKTTGVQIRCVAAAAKGKLSENIWHLSLRAMHWHEYTFKVFFYHREEYICIVQLIKMYTAVIAVYDIFLVNFKIVHPETNKH